ncbi:MAG: peptidoglycan-binding protein [Reyranella sp.]|uniref:peptidoglycan-binding domain-containing protein n=1 Tax=Reyranella sp. TaxID=1929291 RepID=UPI0012231123|nr:peptidoglycan-binding domain-containing protein [Reyranella sp.]TAJ35492.1 MAG: peptidoglycan-binding protein [Reyranella sp.]
MALKIEETIGGAPAVGLLAIGVMALALVFTHPGGQSLLKGARANYSPQLPAERLAPPPPQVLSPSVAEILAPPKEEPRPKVTLSRDEIGEVQAWLRAYDFHPGPVDLAAGPRTFAAVKAFEAAHQLPETGNLNRALLETLRRKSGLPLR